jgi:hypothetical protein
MIFLFICWTFAPDVKMPIAAFHCHEDSPNAAKRQPASQPFVMKEG